MRIDYMQEFLVLEKTRNFSEAAKLLHMSQSALSKHISALEDEIDMDLFKRLGNTLQLTEAGSVFRDSAAIVVNDHNSLLARMRAIKARSGDVVEIGYLPTVASSLIGPLHEWFGKHAPDVNLRIRPMAVAELQPSLMDKTINYAITLDFGGTDERCSSYPIYDEEFFLVLPPDHRLADAAEITRADLKREIFLIPGSAMPGLATKLNNAFGMLDAYRDGIVYQDVRAVLDLVAAGCGIAIAGGHNKSTHPQLVFKRLADLDDPITFPVSLIWQTEHERVKSIAPHIAMLKAAVDAIQKTQSFE